MQCEKRTKINKKEAGFGPFKKNEKAGAKGKKWLVMMVLQRNKLQGFLHLSIGVCRSNRNIIVSVTMPVVRNKRELWSSGYGMRLMFQRLWVWIPAPYTGWSFFTFICCKNYNFYNKCLFEKTKINGKEAGDGPFKKRNKLSSRQWRQGNIYDLVLEFTLSIESFERGSSHPYSSLGLYQPTYIYVPS